MMTVSSLLCRRSVIRYEQSRNKEANGKQKQIGMNTQEDSEQKKKRVNVTIREMEIDDLASVFHLGEQLFTAQEVPNLFRTWDEYEVITLYQGDPEFCLVAEVEDRIVGFALGTTITKSRSAWKYGHLVWLGVDPALHRQGLAEKLFSQFQDLMLEDGVRMLLVDSEADNLPALHFFRKMGFGNPQEHIYLSLNLASQQRQFRGEEKQRPPAPQAVASKRWLIRPSPYSPSAFGNCCVASSIFTALRERKKSFWSFSRAT